MTPDALKPEDFRNYPPVGRSFAVKFIEVLRGLPPAVCPSFVLQIRNLDTSFPFEQKSLRAQFDALAAIPQAEFSTLSEPLRQIPLPEDLLHGDWVDDPAAFITRITAFLWSSGQIDRFREGAEALFAALPDSRSSGDRLVIVVMGQGADLSAFPFARLRHYGVFLQNVRDPDVPRSLFQLAARRAAASPTPYAHWYIDGDRPWPSAAGAAGITQISYAALAPLRLRVLGHMRDTIFSGDAGTEAMQTRLSTLTPNALNASQIVSDPVLQRFYTELFTLSSGPQLFSTSFVQWAARELMRRAQPQTLFLRYAPRQRHRPFNEMVAQAEAENVLDPEGSLRDAEMGAYYALLEVQRTAAPAAITLLAWHEGTSKLLVIAPNAPAGTETSTQLTLQQALTMFS